MLTDSEKRAVQQYNNNNAFLEPFRRITDEWGVGTTHKFQSRIRGIDLVASGDLANDWTIKVLARDTGVVVAEFSFAEHGRFKDMRKVDYTKPVPVGQFFDWVDSKVDKRQIQYSTLAEKLNVSFTDPRVIHDVAYRIAKAQVGQLNYKRRRWYNKGKESSLNDLYTKLQDAMSEAARAGLIAEFYRAKKAA